jgi:diaminohydroxyphosphoribosylaminopyrimidine deaminase/5-amino-6-(5-phosphoribosylamino)uracil reductase
MSNFMQQALFLAAKGRLKVAPNPMVGCIIERDGEIVGQGWHKGPGQPHAEIEALKEAGIKAQQANVYVNLEPCCHYGRTPPCVDALIKAQVKSVHIPFIDPNPLVNGQGAIKLKEAGIEVYIGEEEKAARQLNEVFLYYITNKRPYVIAKWAMSLDGKMATDNGHAKWISSAESRDQVQQIRREVSAILVGSKTVINDDPELIVRITYRQPLRIILDSSGNIPLEARILNPNLLGKTLIATTEKSPLIWQEKLLERGIEILICPANKEQKVDIVYLVNELGKREISSLLVEGGREVLASFFAEKLINKIYTYIAPKLIGKIANMQNAAQLIYEQHNLGQDMLITAKPVWNE